MPRLAEMRFAGNRWRRMYRGVRYVVSCRQLGAPEGKTASQTAANEWWRTKKAEVDSEFQGEKQAALPAKLDTLIQTTIEAALMQLQLKLMQTPALAPYMGMIQAKVEQATSKEPDPLPAENQTLGFHFLRFRELQEGRVKAGQLSAGRFASDVRFLQHFVDWIKPETPCISINEAKVSEFFAYLLASKEWGNTTKRKIFQLMQRFVEWLDEQRQLEKPRNLRSATFRIKTAATAITTWTVEDVRGLLDSIPQNNPAKLYLLLMLNCGFYGMDVASLRHSEINWQAGTISKKRTKTAGVTNCPVVTWQLWKETLDLLKQHKSNKGERVLLADDGKPLVINDLDERRDMVAASLKPFIKGMPQIKKLRATSASMLEQHPEYGRYTTYFLGHSPSGTAARHYVLPSEEQFKKALEWLRLQYFNE